MAVDNAINPRDYIGRFWIDSLVHDAAAMKYIMEVIGENKICLGSDYPFPLGEKYPGKLIQAMNLSPDVNHKLMFANTMEWLEG